MAKLKKLKLPNNISTAVPQKERAFIDRVDDLYSEEHIGYYLIVNLEESNSRAINRIYLSRKKQIEYYEKKYEGTDTYWRKPKSDLGQHLYDSFPEYKNLILEYFKTILNGIESYSIVKTAISGINIVLKNAQKENIILNDISSLDVNTQKKIQKVLLESSSTNHERRMFCLFFTKLDSIDKNFVAIDLSDISTVNIMPREALPLTVIYQIDFYARKELKKIFLEAKEFREWMIEIENKDLYSLANLAKTFYDEYTIDNKANTHTRLMKRISLDMYGVDFPIWKSKSGESVFFADKKNEDEYNKLIKLGETKGKNIAIVNEKNFALWHKTLFPSYPLDNIVDPRYQKVFSSFRDFRLRYHRMTGKEVIEFDRRMFPVLQTAYLLAVVLLIREGINIEVLKSWRIKELSHEGLFVGDSIAKLATLITGIKRRTNSIITTAISANSEEKFFIDSYLKQLTPYYKKSGSDLLFQYFSPQKGIPGKWKTSEWIKDSFFTNVMATKQSLFKKYTIYDTGGERIFKVQHSKIRPSVNYADYLKGFTLFERQHKLGHKDVETQKGHYENSAEWKGSKMHRIAKTQELIVGVFGGKVERENIHAQKLYAGLLSDCKNPLNPNYPGAIPLKENEVCGDWFKCLTQCAEARVIPSVHGETICACILHMEEQKSEFIRIEDWEKEYLVDYLSAKSTLECFTEEELKYAQENAYKHIGIMRKRFKSRLKINKKRKEYGA